MAPSFYRITWIGLGWTLELGRGSRYDLEWWVIVIKHRQLYRRCRYRDGVVRPLGGHYNPLAGACVSSSDVRVL